jgi:hypothetical protein
MLDLNALEDAVTMLAWFASWLLHTVAQFLDPIVTQVLSTAKSCLSRLSLVCQSNLPPSLQALGEMLLDNINENVVFYNCKRPEDGHKLLGIGYQRPWRNDTKLWNKVKK